jgi:hypothetical protein
MCLALLGCSGSNTGRITGKALLDGQPIAGTVVFVGENAKQANGNIGAGGAYEISRAPVGKGKLYVVPERLPELGRPAADAQPGLPKEPEPPSDPSAPAPGFDQPSPEKKKAIELAAKIPSKYRDATSSPFVLAVQSGDNPFDLNIGAGDAPGIPGPPGLPGAPGAPPPPPQ